MHVKNFGDNCETVYLSKPVSFSNGYIFSIFLRMNIKLALKTETKFERIRLKTVRRQLSNFNKVIHIHITVIPVALTKIPLCLAPPKYSSRLPVAFITQVTRRQLSFPNKLYLYLHFLQQILFKFLF